MKQGLAKVMAILALLGIIISVVGTGILYMIESNNSPQTIELTEEQLQEMINSNQIEANITSQEEQEVNLEEEVEEQDEVLDENADNSNNTTELTPSEDKTTQQDGLEENINN